MGVGVEINDCIHPERQIKMPTIRIRTAKMAAMPPRCQMVKRNGDAGFGADAGGAAAGVGRTSGKLFDNLALRGWVTSNFNGCSSSFKRTAVMLSGPPAMLASSISRSTACSGGNWLTVCAMSASDT